MQTIDKNQINTIDKIQKNVILLNETLVERAPEINLLFVAAIAGKNVLFLGPPGTAKSQQLGYFAKIFKCEYFKLQLMKSSRTEEMFGPFSVKELTENDRLVRKIEGFLPSAEFAFLDEVTRGPSMLLNGTNEILNEHTFNGNIRCPLILAVGAANFISDDEDLEAFNDRWTCRKQINYIKSDENFKKLLVGLPVFKPITIEVDELKSLSTLLEFVDLTEILDQVVLLRETLEREQVIVSDRRWAQGMDIIKAFSIMNKRLISIPKDLRILNHVLWDDEKEINIVKRAIEDTLKNSFIEKFKKLDSMGKECYDEGMDNLDPKIIDEAIKGVEHTLTKAECYVGESMAPNTKATLEEIIKKLKYWRDLLYNHLNGIAQSS